MPALELLADLALLSSLSALVHYFFGLYGVLAAAAGVSLLEHGGYLADAARARLAHKSVERARHAVRERVTALASGRGGGSGQVEQAAAAPTWAADAAEDTRALLEQLADSAADVTYDFGVEPEEPSPLRPAHDDAASDESAASSSEEPSPRLVIRDIGSQPGDSLLRMNSRAPVAFETELFAGHVHFLVRTTPEDPHWTPLFRGRRRMFWIQVQGAFKRAPRGTVYLGGELPAQIAPGLFTRSIALVIMGIIQQLVGNVNFSFGDADSDVVPSIALPLYQSADQLVVTPAGAAPPPLGARDFGETDAARRLRRATPVGSERYEVGATYSFDFHTMYVDLTRWRTANLPGLSEMELSTFFDSLPLRMVAYEVCATPSERHRQRQKQYLFNFEVQYNRQHGGGRGSGDSAGSVTTQRSQHRGSTLTRRESENSDESASVAGGVGSTDGMSTVVSDASSSFDDASLLLDEVLFLNQERARRLGALSVAYLCWLEEVDVATGVRRVHFVYALRDARGGGEAQQLAVVSAYELRILLLGRRRHKGGRVSKHPHPHRRNQQLPRTLSSKDVGADDTLAALDSLRFHSQSRIGCYSTISDEALVVADCVRKLVNSSRSGTTTSTARRLGSSNNLALGDRVVDEREGSRSDPSPDGEEDSFPVEPPASSPSPLDLLNESEEVAFQAALYQCLTRRAQLQAAPTSTTAACSPSKIGVNLSKRDRDDMRVVFEGVVYRYYTETLLRQEVLVVTVDELLFYRSYCSSAEKRVACGRVVGVRVLPSLPLMRNALTLPEADADASSSSSCGAFALEITTFAEQIVLCVGTEHARSVWLRILSQHCELQANLDRSLGDSQLAAHICSDTNKPLKPANRIILNSRALFPQRPSPTSTTITLSNSSSSNSDSANTSTSHADLSAGEDATRRVQLALELALDIHNRGCERVSMAETLAFLDAASSLRGLKLRAALLELSHEAQMALFLNLFHVVLAHAMIAHGFPRSKGQWANFLARMCYSVGLNGDGDPEGDSEGGHEQMSLSLAEIEHVLLRRRMPAADLPYLNVSSLAAGDSGGGRGSSSSVQRRRRCLEGLGLSHPDFRLTFALATNQQQPPQHSALGGAHGGVVAVYEPQRVHDQLNAVAASVLHGAVSVEKRRDGSAVIFLPRICEWYRLDFGAGGSPLYCARKLLGFLDERAQQEVLEALEDPLATRTKYRDFAFVPKTALVRVALAEDGAALEAAVPQQRIASAAGVVNGWMGG
ncbi:hypothetical protein PybrP1_007863 [[Pythium] brassicae (nom. inval.)]|nr:hypothetical protein PybrP1_007863 [[Pythium] brassicae (nom. inval.)]